METKQIRFEGKAFQKSNMILRFFSLLNVINPGKFELNTWNADASIECVETGLSVVVFNGNIIR